MKKNVVFVKKSNLGTKLVKKNNKLLFFANYFRVLELLILHVIVIIKNICTFERFLWHYRQNHR